MIIRTGATSDEFYAQIGSLTNLGVLDLKAVGEVNNGEEMPYSGACLPGLLALEDFTTE